MFRKFKHILRDVDERDAGSADILDIFSMDFEGSQPAEEETPKAEEPKVEEPVQEPEAPESEPVPAEPAAPEVEPAAPAEPTPPAPASAPSSDELLKNAMKVIETLTQKQAVQAAPKEEPKVAPAEDEDEKVFKPREFSDYTFNINQKLYTALFSPDATEEERMGALQGFASGIATTVHNNIINSLGRWTKENFSAIPRAVNYLIEKREASQSSAKSIRDDFYSSFPELNKPELLPLIKATIQSVQRETRAQAWTPQVKNLVGSRVKNLLNAYAASANPIPAAAPKTIKTSATPPAVKPQSLDPNSSDAILSIFDDDF